MELEIDGGINVETAPLAAAAGADILVSGSAIFHADGPAGGRGRDPGRGLARARHDLTAVPAAKVLTVSDGVDEGVREDTSGAALVARLDRRRLRGRRAPGQRRRASRRSPGALRAMTDGFAGLVVTTGGTGLRARATSRPEGTRAVIEREAPGMAEAIRRVSDEGGRGLRDAVARGVRDPGRRR